MQKPARRKRIKTRFQNTSEVAEQFALQSIPEARCNNSFFNGARMFSYGHHYLLAELTSFNGVPCAIVNFNKYSKTTSSQSREVFHVLKNSGYIVIEVDAHLTASSGGLEVQAAIISELDKKSDTLYLESFELTFEKRSFWFAKYTLENIDKHNQLCQSLKAPQYQVLLDFETREYIKGIQKLLEFAEHDHLSRRQEKLFTDESCQPSRNIRNKKTA